MMSLRSSRGRLANRHGRFGAAGAARLLVLVLILVADTTPATAAIDAGQAAFIFREAHAICARDAGALWGRSLCGPILLVDPDDLAVVANQADAGGVLRRAGTVFVGTLPPSVTVSDTTVAWSGTRWCELTWPWPLREDTDLRRVTLAHEMFHRIQEDLRIEKLDGDNRHLDSLDGRYLMELEWRALAAALRATKADARRQAVADAILFRRERYQLFPDAATNEAALESNEGIAEYTGVRLGLATRRERTRYALRDLTAFAEVPSLVRSFAYATGPAYGLLFDAASPGWRPRFLANPIAERFDERLATALQLPPPDLDRMAQRRAVYDADGVLRSHEVARDAAKRTQLTAYRAQLVDGPVLTLPLAGASFQFQPQSLVPLDDLGTVYPTMTLTDAWGTLTVKSGGVLVRKSPGSAALSAVGFDPATVGGPGFVLRLDAAWIIVPGPRLGDLVVRPRESGPSP